jgi:hypothetical protein
VYIAPQRRAVRAKIVDAVEPASAPSLNTSYPTTPMLSVDGDQEMVMLEEVTSVCATLTGTLGGWVSVHDDVAARTTAREERLPAKSYAWTAIW